MAEGAVAGGAVAGGATFGELLRHLRKRAGFTQGALAAAAGCSVSYISALETGQRRPDAGMVQARMAPALAGAGAAHLVARLLELATATGGGGLSDRASTSLCAADRGANTASAASSDLFGRDADIDALCKRLMNHPGRLLTLIGPPGVGKTSLAQAVVCRLAPFHADGAHTVWLGEVSDSALVAAAIATALGSIEDQRPPEARLIDLLRSRELLLFLDNFDDFARVASITSLVANLLQACPRLRILVTSRTRLKLRAEQSIQIQPLDSQSAGALFVARVRTHQPSYAPTPTQQAAIDEICRLLDNLPLAIELIAAHASEMTVQDLLTHVRTDRLTLLEKRAAKLSSEQRTLIAALQHSYALLAPPEQRALRILSVFDGGVGLDGVTALAVDLLVVQALADKSLVRIESVGDGRRVRLLETVREYAAMLLAADESDDAQLRRLAWCLALAEQATPLLHSAGQTRWLRRLEPERFNFYAAIRHGLKVGAVEVVIRIVVALRHFWVARNHLAEIAPWFDSIESAAVDVTLDSSLRARFLNCRGTIAFYRGQYDLAGAYFLAALKLAQAVGDQQEIAYAFDGLGAQAVNLGQLAVARTFSASSLEHATAVGDEWLAGIALMNLGEIARMEGGIAAAAAYYRVSLSRLQRSGDPYFCAIAEINLGQIYLLQGDHAHAEALLRQALAAGLQAESAQVAASALEKLTGALYTRDSVTAGRLFSLAQEIRRISGVTVQPVDQADYAHLAAQLEPVAVSADVLAPVAEGIRLNWRAIQAAIAAISG